MMGMRGAYISIHAIAMNIHTTFRRAADRVYLQLACRDDVFISGHFAFVSAYFPIGLFDAQRPHYLFDDIFRQYAL